jgi:hypothetical protein
MRARTAKGRLACYSGICEEPKSAGKDQVKHEERVKVEDGRIRECCRWDCVARHVAMQIVECGSARACSRCACLNGESETRQQVKQKESQRTHSCPVTERTLTRHSKNIHVSDSAVSHSFSTLARGGDSARATRRLHWRDLGARWIGDEGRLSRERVEEVCLDEKWEPGDPM